MPELPDITIYVEALASRGTGRTLNDVRIRNSFLLRSVDPPIADASGRNVTDIRRAGKRIIIALDGELFLVLHLMIAGRLQWKPAGAKLGGKSALAAFEFSSGTLTLTEAGTTRRASLHLVRGEEALSRFARGGLEVLDDSLAEFASRLTSESHTLKRALTEPRLFSGIGNAYSDEILHRARLSPLQLTQRIAPDDVACLYEAARATLREWTDRLRRDTGDAFPVKVAAFREGMAVHGRYGEPCPVCEAPVQRIRYAENETNYCSRCQTGGRLLADRAFSRLLRDDWPRRIEELQGA